MKVISIKGIILGTITVMVATVVASIALYAAVGRKLPAEELYTNTENLLWSVFGGTVSTIIGGYVTAKIAKNYPYVNALALGVIWFIIGIIITFGVKTYPLWFIIVGFVVNFPAVLLGAYLGKPKVK
jgi:peptidoglycan/LPS O-acetylase OafA/YrhL